MAYRYTLTREFEPTLFGPPVDVTGLFIALNPSTADDEHPDATVRRWTGFAKAWGWRRYHVGNLYAWRATHPIDLWKAPDPVGPDNDRHLVELVAKVNGPVVCCWGNNARPDRVKAVFDLLREYAVTPYALRVTLSGQPEHVSRLPKTLTPRPLSDLLGERRS